MRIVYSLAVFSVAASSFVGGISRTATSPLSHLPQPRCAAPRAVATRPPAGSSSDSAEPQSAAAAAPFAAEAMQEQQQQQSVVSALENMLPGMAASSVVTEAADAAAAATILPGSWQSQDQVGNEAILQSRDKLLEESYEACRQITKQYAKTFYFGTKFFDEDKRKAVWAVYAWCRRTDDIVDKPRKETGSLRTELAEWGRRLKDVWNGRAHDLIDLALVDTVRNYPELSIEPFEDMIKGMVMDLDQNRFETFEELYIYCYRVAGKARACSPFSFGLSRRLSRRQAAPARPWGWPALSLARHHTHTREHLYSPLSSPPPLSLIREQGRSA